MSLGPKPPEWVVSRKARIRKGLKVKILMGSEGFLAAEWDPSPPNNLTSRQMIRYRRARDEAVAEFAKRKGVVGKVLTVEV